MNASCELRMRASTARLLKMRKSTKSSFRNRAVHVRTGIFVPTLGRMLIILTDSKLKKDTDEQIAKLQSDLQDANNKIEKAQTASKKREAQWTSKLQSSTKELTDWKHKFDAEVDKNNVVQLDYEATLEEISTMKAELSKSKERDEKRDEKYVALENELAALR